MSNLARKKKTARIIISFLIGCFITVSLYSLTVKITYPELNNHETDLLRACHKQLNQGEEPECPMYISREVIDDGLPLRSRFVDNDGLSIDFDSKGPSTPLIIIAFFKNPALYINTIFWISITYFLIEKLTKKQHAHSRH